VVKLIENDNLILVEGSVPGSKNGIVMLKDAIKSKLPETAPFPAGLYSGNDSKETIVDDLLAEKKNIDENPENNGDQVEN
jgi:large subunit ribosomal protein L3